MRPNAGRDSQRVSTTGNRKPMALANIVPVTMPPSFPQKEFETVSGRRRTSWVPPTGGAGVTRSANSRLCHRKLQFVAGEPASLDEGAPGGASFLLVFRASAH